MRHIHSGLTYPAAGESRLMTSHDRDSGVKRGFNLRQLARSLAENVLDHEINSPIDYAAPRLVIAPSDLLLNEV